MGWFSDLRKELKGEKLPGTHGNYYSGPGEIREVHNPVRQHPGWDLREGCDYRYQLSDGYEIEDGEVIHSSGILTWWTK